MADNILGTPMSNPAHDAWVSGGNNTPAETAAPAVTATPSVIPDTSSNAASTNAELTPAVTAATQAGAEAAGDAAAKAAGEGTPEGEAARAAAIQNYLEGQLDGKPYQVPKGLQLPYKRGKETVYRPVEEVLRLHANFNDLQSVKARVADRERQIKEQSDELELREQAMEARRAAIEDEYQQLQRAFEDPDEADRLQRHREMLATDPQYKRMYEDSLAKRELDAVSSLEQQRAVRYQTEQITVAVDNYIRAEAAKYPGIDPDQVVELYGRALASGELKWPSHSDPAFDDTLRWLVPQQVSQVFQQAKAQYDRTVGPVQQELATLRDELRQLREEREAVARATAQNDQTQKAIARSRDGRFAAPAGGAPPGPAARQPAKPFTSDQLEDRKRDWATRRD